jgi:cytochrome c oxidase assembly protein subunit 15
MDQISNNTTPLSPWPHRLAVALVCVVFPLIWVGGLVTTYDAGMAVPDWPGTYGYNLFLYPWTTWIAGPWDLFIEHGHRLLGATAGFVTIGFVVAVFAFDRRVSMRFLAIAAFALILGQGILGGRRVLLDARQIALIHGCLGPFFFAFCACLAVVTSRRWQQGQATDTKNASLTRSALIGVLLAYGQLVLGAFLRHPSDAGSPQSFRLVLLFHIVVALALIGHVIGLTIATYRRAGGDRWLTRPATAVAGLLALQLLLGFATLIVKYGWPAWLGGELLASGFTVTAKGFWSSMIVTAHVANGSLILATLAVLWIRTVRRFGWQASMPSLPSRKLLGVAA